jgi:hypothetical protein
VACADLGSAALAPNPPAPPVSDVAQAYRARRIRWRFVSNFSRHSAYGGERTSRAVLPFDGSIRFVECVANGRRSRAGPLALKRDKARAAEICQPQTSGAIVIGAYERLKARYQSTSQLRLLSNVISRGQGAECRLDHKFRRLFCDRGRMQHWHRSSVVAIATARKRRIVAIELGT